MKVNVFVVLFGLLNFISSPALAEEVHHRFNKPLGLSFHEKMAGHIQINGNKTKSHFVIDVDIEDIEKWAQGSSRDGVISGYIDILSERIPISGIINIFSPSNNPNEYYMRYQMHSLNASSNFRSIDAYKVIHDDPGLDLIKDVTTLRGEIKFSSNEELTSWPVKFVFDWKNPFTVYRFIDSFKVSNHDNIFQAIYVKNLFLETSFGVLADSFIF